MSVILWSQEDDSPWLSGFGKTVGQGGCGRSRRRRVKSCLLWFERRTERAFDQLSAVNFHGRQWAKITRQFLGLERQRLPGRLAADQFGRQAGDRDGRFAAKGLEGRAVDDFPAVFLLELHPQAEHFAAIGVAHGADGIRARQFAHVLRVGERFLNPFLQIVVHKGMES